MSYQWLKGGVNLSEGGNISGVQTPTLTLSNVLGGDAGGYSAIISNAFGSVTSLVATLTVVDPLITSPPVTQNANPGDTVGFSVTAVGTAPLGYQWRKEGAAVAKATTASLTLTNVQGAAAGGYDVVVSNVFGTVTSVVALLTVNLATADAFNPGATSDVYCLVGQADGKILVGGYFMTLGRADAQPDCSAQQRWHVGHHLQSGSKRFCVLLGGADGREDSGGRLFHDAWAGRRATGLPGSTAVARWTPPSIQARAIMCIPWRCRRTARSW